MKNKLGDHLARLLTFAWRMYKRNKARKEEEEKKRKAKAKAKKKKKGGRAAGSFSMKKGSSMTNSMLMPPRKTVAIPQSPASNKLDKKKSAVQSAPRKLGAGESDQTLTEGDENSEVTEAKEENDDINHLSISSNVDAAMTSFGRMMTLKKINISEMQTVPEEDNISNKSQRSDGTDKSMKEIKEIDSENKSEKDDDEDIPDFDRA